MIFKTQHDQHRDRHGQFCRVIRELRDGEEIDKSETGPMFRIRFVDGIEIDAFADELIYDIADSNDAQDEYWRRVGGR